MSTYDNDNFVCHTIEGGPSTVRDRYRLTSVDTGAGHRVRKTGANESVTATSVDKKVVCVRQSIDSHNFFSQDSTYN